MKNALVAPRSWFMGRVFCRIDGFSGFLGLIPDFSLPIRGIVHDTHLVLLNAWVTVRTIVYITVWCMHKLSSCGIDWGNALVRSGSTSVGWIVCRICGFSGFSGLSPDSGSWREENHSQHPFDAFD